MFLPLPLDFYYRRICNEEYSWYSSRHFLGPDCHQHKVVENPHQFLLGSSILIGRSGGELPSECCLFCAGSKTWQVRRRRHVHFKRHSRSSNGEAGILSVDRIRPNIHEKQACRDQWNMRNRRAACDITPTGMGEPRGQTRTR